MTPVKILPLLCVALLLCACHGDPTQAQVPLAGISLRSEANATAAASTLAGGRVVSVRTLPFYKSKDFRQLLTDAGTPEGFVAAAELWPFPLEGKDVYAALGEVKLSNGTVVRRGNKLQVATKDLVPGQRIVIVGGAAVATVALTDVRDDPLPASEWKDLLIRSLKLLHWTDVAAAAPNAGVPELALIHDEHALAENEREAAQFAAAMPPLEWTGMKDAEAPGHIRGLTSKVLDAPNGKEVKVLQFGSPVLVTGVAKGWAQVSFNYPAEVFIDSDFTELTVIAKASTGVGMVKQNEVTGSYPTAGGLRATANKHLAKPDLPRALNTLAYLELLGHEGWSELVDLSFKLNDFSYLRGLVRTGRQLGPVRGDTAMASWPSVSFVSACKDFIRQGNAALIDGPPDFSPLDDSGGDCFDLHFPTPCEVANGADQAQDQISDSQRRTWDREAAEGERARAKLIRKIDAAQAKYGKYEATPFHTRITFGVPKECAGQRYFVFRASHTTVESGPYMRDDVRKADAMLEIPAEALECGSAVVITTHADVEGAVEYAVLRAKDPVEAGAWVKASAGAFTINESIFGPKIQVAESLKTKLPAVDDAGVAEGAELVTWGLSRHLPSECNGSDGSASAFIRTAK